MLYSTTNSAPVYPDDNAVFVGSKDDNENSFKLKYGKNHYIRLCAITAEADYRTGRYCSEVVKLEVAITSSVKQFSSTKKVEAKTYEKKETIDKEYTEKQYTNKTVELSDSMRARVDTMLEKFMDRLDSKGYSDDKKLEALDRIM